VKSSPLETKEVFVQKKEEEALAALSQGILEQKNHFTLAGDILSKKLASFGEVEKTLLEKEFIGARDSLTNLLSSNTKMLTPLAEPGKALGLSGSVTLFL